jgi:hypothetical protein
VKQRALTLVVSALTFGGAIVFISRILWPDVPVPLYSAVALSLCLVPTLVTLIWAGWALNQAPEQQLLTILGGTGLRMVLVLGIGLALYQLVPTFHRASFWIVILIFYLFILALEVVLLLRVRDQRK